MRKFLYTAIMIAGVSVIRPASANPGDVFVEIMAAPEDTTATFPWFTVGHAFVCIAYDLTTGIKEDCYGFYPDPKSTAVYVGGSNLSGEFKENPLRFSDITWSVKKKVNSTQLSSVRKLINSTDDKTYKLFSYNCGDLVHDVVDALGWANVTKGLLPEPYVRDVYEANIARFEYKNGKYKYTLRRNGGKWTNFNDTGVKLHEYTEITHDDTYIYMDDGKVVEWKVPLKKGIILERDLKKDPWFPKFQATPIFD